MRTQCSLFLAVSVGFAACTDTSVHTSDTASAVSDAHVVDGRLTVHVIEAEAGGWGSSDKARAAMESLAGVDRLMMNGVRATLVLAKGATLSEADAKDALAEHGLKFGSLERCEVDIPVAAYVAMTPKSLWAATAKKAREAFLNDVPAVQDIFFGKETVVHIKRGGPVPLPEVLEAQLTKLKIACDGIRRDDSAIL